MTKRKLLYVDDEQANLFLFEVLFQPHFDLVLASSGREAIDQLAEDEEIEIIITDLRMPEMDGYELLKEVRVKYPQVYRCVLTAFLFNNELDEAIKEGLVQKAFKKLMNSDEMVDQLLQGF